MRSRVILLLVGTALLVIASASAFLWNLARYRDALNSVEHTHEALRNLATTEGAMLQAELGKLGWVLSGNTIYLQAYREAANAATHSLQTSENLPMDSEQLRRFSIWRGLIESRLASLARATPFEPQEHDETLKILAAQFAPSMKKAFEAIRQIEQARLIERKRLANRELYLTTASAFLMAILAVLCTLFGGSQLHKQRMIREFRSAKRYLAVLDSSPEAIVGFDDAGLIDLFSGTAERMFQLTREEALGRNISTLLSEAVDAASFMAIAAENPKTIREIMAQRKDGSAFVAALHVRYTQLNGTVRYACFLSDLLEGQALQAEQWRGELLHVSRLITMGEMAAALAHELNQPLTALAAYLYGARQLLSEIEGEKNATAMDALNRAAGQAVRAGDVIRRLREFVDRGETEKGIESLKIMVQEAFALATITHQADMARVTLALDPSVDLVLANKIQVQQVLLNLIRNGWQAMSEGPRRRLLISSAPAPDGMVAITVADRGSGIPPEVARTLFQSFTSTKKDGFGLGLSISRTIVEAHGGRISAEPNPGGGTIFRFTLRSGRFQLGPY